ncbi:hypothetical protein GCM10009422_01780 [Brevundimonas kwangchunensis]|uniref:Uncharacterized protein n=1 Tax=Brevundimonas kwangchunensis TaxID=322163 RepID=A0ABN1GFP6_9CAUL
MKLRAFALTGVLMCGACSTPMLTSVDLRREAADGALATYAIGVTDIEIRRQPYGGAATLPEACADALATYDAARASYDEAWTPYDRARTDAADILSRLAEASPPSLTELQKRTTLARLRTLSGLANAARAAEAVALRAEERVDERCPVEQPRLEALSYVRPSPQLLFGLRLDGGMMSNDTLTIETSPDGLLTSITASADDQAGAAVVETATLIGRFSVSGSSVAGVVPDVSLGYTAAVAAPGGGSSNWLSQLFPGLAAVAPPPPPPPPPTAAERCRIAALPPEAQMDRMDERLDCVDLPSLRHLLQRVGYPSRAFPNKRPKAPLLPERFPLTELQRGGVHYDGLTISANCMQPVSSDLPTPAPGVVVATPTPCELVIDTNDGHRPRRFGFTGVSARHLTVVPVERADLVRNTTDLDFRSGMVSSVDVERPSVGAAAFALPGRAVTGVVRGITDALGNSKAIEEARVAQMTAETSRIQAEAARVTPPRPAWSAADTTYVSAMAEVETRRAEHARWVSADTPDPVQIATAAGALRNAQANANAAAQAAGRPLPFPDLI